MLMFHGTSTDTMPANRTAGGFRQIIDEIEEETGLEAKVEASDWNIKIELKRGAKMVGYFRASAVNPDSFEWGNAPSDCKEAWGQMGEPPVWVIRGAEWFDRDLRGKGFGKLLYKALFSYIASQKGVVGPDLCSGGNTSPDAQRVWRSLRSMYPKHGPLIDLRKMASPSRVAGRYIEAGLLKPPPGLAYVLGVGPEHLIGGYLHEKYPDSREFKKYRPLKGNSTPTLTIDLDRRGLTGWPYLRRAGVSPEEFMAQVWGENPALAKLQVTIDFNRPKGSAGGYYTETNRAAIIHVYAMESAPPLGSSPPPERDIHKWMDRVEDIIDHELLHYTQALLSVLAKTQAGFPSPHTQTPDNDYGEVLEIAELENPTDEQWIRGDELHALRDIEFYPRLKDEISAFNRKTFPTLKAWEDARKAWVGGTDRYTRQVKQERARPFFKALKKRAPRKWRKAVGEFMRATQHKAPDAPKTTIPLPSGTATHTYKGTDRGIRRMLENPEKQLRAEVQAFRDRVEKSQPEYEAALAKLKERNRQGKERGRPPRDLASLDYKNPAIQFDGARESWVGAGDPNRPVALGDEFISPRPFFKALREYAPDQYETVAKEFMRATKGNPSRVAARYTSSS